MKRRLTCLALLLCSLLVCPPLAVGQRAAPPEHRLAVRWNTLGVLNLDGIGEIEYSASRRLGVFAGWGTKAELAYPDRLVGHSRPEGVKGSAWGACLGARIAIPVGRLSGLAVKASACYQRVRVVVPLGEAQVTYGCFSPTTFVLSPTLLPLRQGLGAYLGLAYTREFAGRFLVEPVVGLGPELTSSGNAPLRFTGFASPLQLNLGVRF